MPTIPPIPARTTTGITTRAITTKTKMAFCSTTNTTISVMISSSKRRMATNSIFPFGNTVRNTSAVFDVHSIDRSLDNPRVYRGTTRGRPRGRGRPPLYGRGGRATHTVQPPRGVNHLTTGSFQSSQQFIQPKLDAVKSAEQPARNKRKPAKVKSTPVTPAEEKPRRPGKILRSGRISRKPRRDSETDFGSDNSDDSGAKDKDTGSDDDDDDEEFHLTQLGRRTRTFSSTNDEHFVLQVSAIHSR